MAFAEKAGCYALAALLDSRNVLYDPACSSNDENDPQFALSHCRLGMKASTRSLLQNVSPK